MLSSKLEDICSRYNLDKTKLPVVKQRVEKMLKRQVNQEPVFLPPKKIICQECHTFDWDIDVHVDQVMGTVICLHCGLELNCNLPYESIEEHYNPTLIEEDFFSAQHKFKSRLIGGTKSLRAINNQVENNIRSHDGKTRERYKDDQRNELYDALERWSQDVGLDQDVIIIAKSLVNKLRTNTARLHSPLLALIVCLMIAEDGTEIRTRSEEQGRTSKRARTGSYGPAPTSKERWAKAVEQQGKEQTKEERKNCTSASESEGSLEDHGIGIRSTDSRSYCDSECSTSSTQGTCGST